jgi:hypothetical protein
MPYNPNTGVYDPDPIGYDPMAGGQTQQPGPAYNNPWYDSQFYGQQNQGGSFQPMPYQPDYTGGMDYTNPPYNPDVFGGGSGNFNTFNPQGVGATTQPVQYPDIWHTPIGGTFTNEFGQQQAITPISFGPQNGGVGNGGSWFGGQQAQLYPAGGGSQLSGFNGAGSYSNDPGMNYASGSGGLSDGWMDVADDIGLGPNGALFPAPGGQAGGPARFTDYSQAQQALAYLNGRNTGSQYRLQDLGNGQYGIQSSVGGGSGGGLTRPGADSVNVNGQQVGLYPQQQQQTTASLPTPAGGTSTLPAFQQALENPNGPYANRQVGDYAPSTAPLNVQNPQTLKDWQDRYYWFEQHQNYLTNPTAPRTQSATNPDYTMPWTVPGGSFAKNVYADSNAQQSFLELQGVLTPERLQEAQQKYGWQQAVPSVSPDQQSVYKTAIQMANADPNSDYSIVQTVGGYGILKRENGGGNVAAMQAAQSARGFISPAVAIARAQAEAQARQQSQAQQQRGGGGRPNYPSGGGGGTPKTTASLPAPAGKTTIQPGPSIDTRMVGGQVNMNQPVEGQIINYNGQMVQYRQGRWVPLAYNGGSQQHASPV